MLSKAYVQYPLTILSVLWIIFGCTAKGVYAQSAMSFDELLTDKAEVRITLDLQDASLKDVLKMLSVQSGLNFIASEAVDERKMTLYLDNVGLKDALDKIFKINNLTYDLDEESGIFVVKDWGHPTIELDTRVYFLKYIRVGNSRLNQGLRASGTGTSSASGTTATSSASTSSTQSVNGLKEALDKIISEYGKITEDPFTNSMIITDMPSKFSLIEQIIAKLDVSIPQVMIEVEILDVDKSAVDKLGIKWPTSPMQLTVPGSRITRFPFGGEGTSGNGYTIDPEAGVFGGPGKGWDFDAWTATKFGPSVMTFIGSTLTLDLLKTSTDTKFLARPKLFVLNNETAELKLSSNEAIGAINVQQGVGESSSTTTSAERAETGVTLQVTPQVSMATGEITMILQPTIRETVNGLQIGTQTTKDVEERSIKSTVRVRDGETVIIGGLLRNKKAVANTKTAFLGDIPIIGIFFRHKDTTGTKDREILVFITPKIMKNPGQMAAANTVVPMMLRERQQDTFASAHRNELISQALGMQEASKNTAQ